MDEFEEIDEFELMYGNDMAAAEEALDAMEVETNIKSLPMTTSSSITAATSPMEKVRKSVKESDVSDAPMEEIREPSFSATKASNSSHFSLSVLDPVQRSAVWSSIPSGGSLKTHGPYLLNRPDMNGSSITCTLPNGRRYFIKRNRRKWNQETPLKPTFESIAGSLDVSIDEMVAEIEKKQVESIARMDHSENEESFAVSTERSDQPDSALWLNKYKPSRFIDLLSDERTNREVLRWVKQWDPVVFNKKNNSKDQTDSDDPRPFNKVIILSGPPGAGKTTLAHIVAKHAGYTPVEINASDDRTPAAIREKVISMMQSHTIRKEKKPSCIILDEIDGAMNGGEGKSAISVLLSIINAPYRVDKKQSDRGRTYPLIRPLICICNNLYAPVLRPLRQVAKIFALSNPTQSRLISRLKAVCRLEKIEASSGRLAALCSAGSNDIRYCFNALQMIRLKTKELTWSSMESILDKKDLSTGVFDAWDAVFFSPRLNASTSKRALQSFQKDSFRRLDGLINASRNDELMLNGLHHNLYSMVLNDPTLNKTSSALEFLEFADQLDTRKRVHQQFYFSMYLPTAAVAIKIACASNNSRKIAYPNTFKNIQQRRIKNESTVLSFIEGCQLKSSLRAGTRTVPSMIIPLALSIINPTIQSISPSLQRKEDKEAMQKIIRLFSYLGLSYKATHLEFGNVEYLLEPDVEAVVKFDGMPTRREVSNDMKQKLSREIELENLKKEEATSMDTMEVEVAEEESKEVEKIEEETQASRRDSNSVAKDSSPSSPLRDNISRVQLDSSVADLSNEKQNSLPDVQKGLTRKQTPFMFPVSNTKRRKRDSNHASKTLTPRRPNITFKFNAGYTSGIKHAALVRDFL